MKPTPQSRGIAFKALVAFLFAGFTCFPANAGATADRVLCIGAGGHIHLDTAHHGRCALLESPPSPSGRHGTHSIENKEPEHSCPTCVDIPLLDGNSYIYAGRSRGGSGVKLPAGYAHPLPFGPACFAFPTCAPLAEKHAPGPPPAGSAALLALLTIRLLI